MTPTVTAAPSPHNKNYFKTECIKDLQTQNYKPNSLFHDGKLQSNCWTEEISSVHIQDIHLTVFRGRSLMACQGKFAMFPDL